MNPVHLDVTMASVSLIFIYAAMAVYTISFLMFVFHMARATSESNKVRTASGKLQLAAFWVLGFGAALHGVGVFLRGAAQARVPWANMYEFSISGSFLIVLIFLTALAAVSYTHLTLPTKRIV